MPALTTVRFHDGQTNYTLPAAAPNADHDRLQRFPAEKIVLTAPPPMQDGVWTHNTNLPTKTALYAAACGDLTTELDVFFVDTRVYPCYL